MTDTQKEFFNLRHEELVKYFQRDGFEEIILNDNDSYDSCLNWLSKPAGLACGATVDKNNHKNCLNHGMYVLDGNVLSTNFRYHYNGYRFLINNANLTDKIKPIIDNVKFTNKSSYLKCSFERPFTILSYKPDEDILSNYGFLLVKMYNELTDKDKVTIDMLKYYYEYYKVQDKEINYRAYYYNKNNFNIYRYNEPLEFVNDIEGNLIYYNRPNRDIIMKHIKTIIDKALVIPIFNVI